MVNVKSLFPFFYRDEPDYRRLSLDEFPRKQGEPADNRDKKSRKWKNRNCCYINLHGTCRYSKLFFPLSFFFVKHRGNETSGARRTARNPAIYFIEEFRPSKNVCFSRVHVVPTSRLYKSPTSPMYSRKRAAGLG